MSPEIVINRLSEELRLQINHGNLMAINDYIQMAVTYGLEQRAIFKSSELLMIDDNNNIIKRFDRLKDAADYIIKSKKFNSNFTTIQRQLSKVIKGERNIAYNYHWRYENNKLIK